MARKNERMLERKPNKLRRPVLVGLWTLCLLFVLAAVPWGQVARSLAEASFPQDWGGLPRVRSAVIKNGVSVTDGLVLGGRAEVERAPLYRSDYYRGGYPPETEGVCTDLIWRAFRDAGYDLKGMVDADIRENPKAYPRVDKPDPNIDFRRVPNLRVFFQRHGRSLTLVIAPGKSENLAQWQPGDIVTFKGPNHIAILSDKRNADGVPYLLHNDGPWASEGDDFMKWYARGITGHFRYPAE